MEDCAAPDGLLPHERAAREKALASTRPHPASAGKVAQAAPDQTAPEQAAPEQAAPEQAAPGRVNGREAAPRPAKQAGTAPAPKTPAPKTRAPAWASAAPSWSNAPSWTGGAPPAAADPGSVNEQQRTDPLASLLPHERAARAAARSKPQPQPQPQPQKQSPRGPLDDLVSFEDVTSARAAPPGGRSRPLQTNGGFRWLPGSLAQKQEDEGEWKNLTRRERKAPLPFEPFKMADSPRPQTTSRPQRGSRNSRPDPFGGLERGAAGGQAAAWAGSNTDADPWKLVEKSVARQEMLAEKAAKDTFKSNWDWADKYEQEVRQPRTPRGARDTPLPFEPIKPARAPGAIEHDREDEDRRERYGRGEEKSERYGRGDRYGREERVERREKPKKSKRRQREMDEDDDDWDEDYEERRQRRAERERRKLAEAEAEAGPTPIFLPEYISVSNLALALGVKVDVFVSQLEELGFEDVSKDNILTGETAALVAQEYGFEPTTTLLDYLRKSSIVSQEHGGITQHIGAFSVSLSSGKQITFLDTPGHAAFLSMRQRGANVTDIIVLVVAADDGVMPQTLEALKHAQNAKVPIIVAINKIDKPEANIERVKADLAANGVEIEDYGGDVQVVCVSGRTGQGMADLEENILLLAELLDIRAETDGMAEGWVLESTIKPIGRVATVLVKRGTLRPGDFIVAGRVHAKVRSLRNEAGVEIAEAPPGTAVEVLGWKEPPEAGDQVLQAPDESRAKAAVRYRQELKERGEVISQMAQQEQERREREREREREKALAEEDEPRNKRGQRHQGASPEEPTSPDADEAPPASTTQYVPFIVKGDVHGSVEAVTAALLELGNNEIRAKVLASAPGMITEWDVERAAVSGSTIVNFNTETPSHIKRLAAEARVPILDHNIIYHLVEDVRARLEDALPPVVVKKVVGEADVLQIFPINIKGRKYKNIAGCRVGNGTVKKGSKARVIRGGENIFEGIIETLKHVKKDVDEMKKGSECGMSFADWDELQVGDHIQVLEEFTEKRRL
ncbi:fd8f08ae-f664-498e-9832-77ca331ba535 [Thermothielavioides terrestris]|uniref:Translation initiation factor IF-2, mitochondrial n=1 Tax=Thermothielavioides terrestris TaxID=2587410 RepID=A0A446BQG8_9PEZI|nr:fd8f08ae-f664-498e-9832-77ca331ba535 [Thermothielavioides terrestris]